MLRKIRIWAGTVFFVLITALLLDITGALHHWLGWTARVQFLPSLMAGNFIIVACLLVLTLVFGRVYCSLICPFGVMQDVIARLGRMPKGKKYRYSYSPAVKWLRYGMFVLFIMAMLAGIGSFVALLAPYSSYGRIVQNLFQPVYIWGNNALAAIAEHFHSYTFYHRDVWIRSISTFVIATVTFVGIAILAWRNGRTYCNTICPVGTFLGFFSSVSLFRVQIDTDKCTGCGLCAKGCKASCIDPKAHAIDYSRCVTCFDCLDNCHQGAITYTRGRVKASDNAPEKGADKVDRTRRAVITGIALAGAGAVMAQEQKKVDGGLAAITAKKEPGRETPLHPAGSVSYDSFASRCTACQLCVAACPNDVLRPSADLGSLMQPYMSYERGYCRPECTRCSEVCPAGAIRPITREEKSSIKIGTAVWIADNCLPVTDGIDCGNCARHCPAGAITMVENADCVMIPAVNTERCIGCGACENLCPARPFSAIYVEGHLSHRTI